MQQKQQARKSHLALAKETLRGSRRQVKLFLRRMESLSLILYIHNALIKSQFFIHFAIPKTNNPHFLLKTSHMFPLTDNPKNAMSISLHLVSSISPNQRLFPHTTTTSHLPNAFQQNFTEQQSKIPQKPLKITKLCFANHKRLL